MQILNGAYKDSDIYIDVMSVNPEDFDLDEDLIWFDVELTANDKSNIISETMFNFYLLDKNKMILNQVTITDSQLHDNTDNQISFFVGFNFKAEFFYNAPAFGVYNDSEEKIELIYLTD